MKQLIHKTVLTFTKGFSISDIVVLLLTFAMVGLCLYLQDSHPAFGAYQADSSVPVLFKALAAAKS